VFRDIEMEDLASTMFDDEETIQNSEDEGRHGEEVHVRDNLVVIAKESRPELVGVVGRREAPEIPRDGAFRDIQAEFQKLTVNSQSAPAGILLHHPPDDSSNLGIDLWPAQPLWPRAQVPEQPKASPMPGDNGFWFDNDQGPAPCRPKSAEQNPKYPILHSQPRTRSFSLEHAQLLTEGTDLETEVVPERKKPLRQVRNPKENGVMAPDL
jgi:hypothetical protein